MEDRNNMEIYGRWNTMISFSIIFRLKILKEE